MENTAKTTDSIVKRPSLIWSLTEATRAIFEYSTYFPFKLLHNIPKNGDKHPVLILPGFLASDSSTLRLRTFIDELGYSVYGWGEGRNFASEEYIHLLLEKVNSIYKRHETPVSIIGWSLGGIYARQLGKALPDKVRQIITLGSPFKDVKRANNAKWMYDLLVRGSNKVQINQELIDDIPYPAPLPTTAIYSKEDGIVPWKLCMEEVESAIHQNIQVRGSHFGLGFNPAVLLIIADRLKYTPDNWKKFESSTLFEKLLVSMPVNLFFAKRQKEFHNQG